MQTEFLCAAPLALVLHWREGRLLSIDLEWAGEDARSHARTPAGLALQKTLESYVRGKDVSWPVSELPLEMLPPFRRRVTRALLEEAPCGVTLTYGQLAALAGSPKAGRAVGQAMANNPWPLLVPCHRVLGSGGRLTGFGPGLAMKQWLLELEAAIQK